MLFFLISCLSFLILSNSFSLLPFPSWVNEMILLLGLLLRELACAFVRQLSVLRFSSTMSFKKNVEKKSLPKVENVEVSEEFTILDLPELALESILGKLPPSALYNMACVCRSLRDRCRSDHLWKKHMSEKWGRVMSPTAYREWQWFIATRRDLGALDVRKSRGWLGSLSCMWRVSWLKSKINSGVKPRSSSPADSIMACYLSLESGKFWFPAQVYNREYGHVGFMLSCYDADLSYDSCTDTFHARYPPHGRRNMVIEEGVKWERLRPPPVSTPAHELHVSDCLDDLRPGDHIEIQWRRSKEFPYGWWYGVVGHLELCDGNRNLCYCHSSDTVMLEFNQYTPGSRWRRTAVNRKDHQEEGNETNGFYGGIRKLHTKEERAMWKQLWPTHVLE
ncbi:F-box protein At2g32560-like [Magnolia sinica]|uniref:F-box protein At2g32560-like n=1 Tax=Magnolia sinica TaxID=86752 RepID=UPI00265A55B9|nr:F-box protein At2g32560-like [Magnolia sinica]